MDGAVVTRETRVPGQMRVIEVVAVVIDTVGGGFVIRSGSSVIARRNIRSAFGVRVASSRDSMSYDPRGLGYGAANLTVSASRGKAAETLFVSRLGRVRH